MAVEFGGRIAPLLGSSPTGYWLDGGTAWNVTAVINGATGERWVDNGTRSGTVSAGATYAMAYQHQYQVSAAASPSGGGSTSFARVWADAGSSVTLGATAASGWRFEGWSGSGSGAFSGNSSSPSFSVGGPGSETALFYPGLTITVSGSGSVGYSYGSTEGTVSSAQTLFVPPGTSVTLSPAPSSFIDSFEGWSGTSGSPTNGRVQVSAPQSLTASFSLDFAVVGGVAALAAIVVAGVLVFARRAGRRGAAPQTTMQ